MLKVWIACSVSILVFAGLFLAHGDATHFMGTITAIDGDHVTLKLQDGKSQMVMFNKATKYLIGKKAAAKADLKVGTRVVIDAKMDQKMKMFLASEVRIGVTTPAATDAKPGTGAPSTAQTGRK
jgi:hypothetical protein